MEILLTNPTRKEIAEAVERAEHAANNGARARTAHFGLVDGKPVHDLVATTKSGLVQRDGGAVANSYKYPADTSYVALGWWTSGSGIKTVRVVGHRVNARKASFGFGHGCAHHSGSRWEFVFPKRTAKLDQSKSDRRTRTIGRLSRQCQGNPIGESAGYFTVKSHLIHDRDGIQVYDCESFHERRSGGFQRLCGLIGRHEATGIIYHYNPQTGDPLTGDNAVKECVKNLKRKVAYQARMARQRKLTDRIMRLEELGDLAEVIVTQEDSIAAGNCPDGTSAFIETYLDGRESATVAELVQVIKSDDFPSCTRPEAVAAILKAVARAKRERRVPVTI